MIRNWFSIKSVDEEFEYISHLLDELEEKLKSDIERMRYMDVVVFFEIPSMHDEDSEEEINNLIEQKREERIFNELKSFIK